MRFPEWVTRPFEARGGQATGGMSGWRSPLGVFLLFGIAFTLTFAVAHTFVEMGLSLLPPLAVWVELLAENAATLVLLLPPFYLLVLQPLARYITDRAEAEAALRVSEQQLSRIFDTVADVIYFHIVEQDGHYRFAAVNRAFHTITGLAPDQVVGKRVDEVIPQPALTFVLEKYKEAIREKRIVRWEETSEYPTGRLVGEVSVAPVFNDAGVCTHLVGAVHDVTERKRNEEALRRVNRALRTLSECNQVLVRATDEPSLLHDMCHTIVSLGSYRLAWVGFAEQDEGKTVRLMAQAGYEEGYLDTVNITWADTLRGRGPTGSAIRTGLPAIMRLINLDPDYEPWRAEATLRGYASSIALPLTTNGQVLGALNIYSPEPDAFDDQEVKLLVEMADDLSYGITALRTRAQHQRMEEALRNSEVRYRSLVDTATVGVFETSSDGTVLYANEAVARILEMDSVQQLLHNRAPDFYKEPSRREELLRILQRDGKVSAFEIAVLTSRGNERQVLLSAALNGSSIRGMLVDITELKQAEKEREANWALVRSLVDGMPDALVVTNDQGLIIDVNAQTEKMFGYERDEILNKSVELLIPDRLKERHVRHRAGYYVRPRLRPMSTVMEMYGRHKDGSEFPIDAMLSPLETPTGLVVIATVRDMTESKQLQAQLMQADRLATVGSIVSGIAHEVNNPLAGALGRAELVLRGNLDDALKADIEVVRSEIWRAALTVRQLLAFAREHKLEKSYISINETLESTLALRQYELTAANVQVVKDLQPDLPTIMADRNQLQQVFLNIILNAEQAMIAAHGRGTLSLRTRQVGDKIVVTMADDGPGILREHLSRVFDPFFTTKPVGKGTGLGLSVSYGIVQEHGGTIRVASKVGKGATFTVVLPIATDEQTGN